MLIRMTMALCASIFGAMAIGGEDGGQKRFGLVPQVPTQQAVAEVVQAPAVTEPVSVQAAAGTAEGQTVVVLANFAPEEPVMVAPAEAVAATTLGQFVFVGENSANVRQGPGKEHAVVGKVTAGQEVELLSQEGDWSYVRTEDGTIEGYVASRLLQV
jgi:uncharacterized protein YgiM (DUF1202 family)